MIECVSKYLLVSDFLRRAMLFYTPFVSYRVYTLTHSLWNLLALLNNPI
jgi:hypothetical protein